MREAIVTSPTVRPSRHGIIGLYRTRIPLAVRICAVVDRSSGRTLAGRVSIYGQRMKLEGRSLRHDVQTWTIGLYRTRIPLAAIPSSTVVPCVFRAEPAIESCRRVTAIT